MKALIAQGVERAYGATSVLKGLDLELEAGAFEALMGPSGCGKSTFLHIAAGLLNADRGSVVISGETITSMNDNAAAKFRRRQVGVVFQAFNLLDDKTVEENILLPLKLDGRKLDRSRLEALSGKLDITSLLKKRPDELSGGERQRVAIARALIAEPSVVLADEPTGNLDTKAAEKTCELLKELNHTEKSAILVVTHDPRVAAAASRVHFMREGVIAASFPTEGDASIVSRLYLENCR